MIKKPIDWTEDDLSLLLGQTESLRLEFKSVRVLDDIQKAGWDLAKGVSAFANSEGGTIVIGIEEKEEGRRKTRIADRIVGAESTMIKTESLQQTILSNVSP